MYAIYSSSNDSNHHRYWSWTCCCRCLWTVAFNKCADDFCPLYIGRHPTQQQWTWANTVYRDVLRCWWRFGLQPPTTTSKFYYGRDWTTRLVWEKSSIVILNMECNRYDRAKKYLWTRTVCRAGGIIIHGTKFNFGAVHVEMLGCCCCCCVHGSMSMKELCRPARWRCEWIALGEWGEMRRN